MDLEKVVEYYVSLRDNIKRQEDELKERCAPLKAQMEQIEGALQLQLQESGATSVKTKAGTAYISTTKKAKATDWEAFTAYVVANNATNLLTKAISSTEVLAAMEEGTEIPGTAVVEITKLNVRRS